MGVYDQWTHLRDGEKKYLLKHPDHALTIKSSKDRAFNETKKRFGTNGHNDASDAFRHCFWSAMLSRDLGYYNAKEFTTAHEDWPGNPPGEQRMDLHNNGVGLQIGRKNTDFFEYLPAVTRWISGIETITRVEEMLVSDSDLSDLCYKALKDGKLQTRP